MLTFAAAKNGGLAQLARAPALQAGGRRFESVILHYHALFSREEFYGILDSVMRYTNSAHVKERQLKRVNESKRNETWPPHAAGVEASGN